MKYALATTMVLFHLIWNKTVSNPCFSDTKKRADTRISGPETVFLFFSLPIKTIASPGESFMLNHFHPVQIR